ncbi:MAG: choice-of-anchor L domain-containing protein [Bacteroidota bacterium]
MKFNHFIFLFALILPFSAVSQVVLDNTLTVEELVNDVLLGNGVTAFNVEYNGMPGDQVQVQAGTFNASSSNFPIDSGVVLSTSTLDIVNNGDGTNPDGFPDFFDQDLADIAGFDSRNSCVIEFDFTVNSDSVKFNYIFASAEYPNFTCSSFNDVFGFFLSGPGINGPFEDNAKNIALIPGTDIQVGVNSVNSGFPQNDQDCLNVNPNYENDSIYFIANSPPDEGGVQILGHTVQLTAEEQIECGGTYHIKLAISNASDQALQSAVFLEAGSFKAFGEVFASFAPVFDGGGGEVTQEGFDSIAVAGCTNPLITLARPQGAQFDTLYFELQGDAVQADSPQGPGDYYVPDFEETFPEGQDTITFEIQTINQNVSDTLDIKLVIFFTGCGNVIDSTIVEVPIAPPPDIQLVLDDLDLRCPNDTPAVFTAMSEGNFLGGAVYEWFEPGFSPYLIDDQLPVPVPEDQASYWVRVTDECEFNYDTLQVFVFNNFPPTFTAMIDAFTQPDCPNAPVDFSAVPVTTGTPPYQYFWTIDDTQGVSDTTFATALGVNENQITFSPNVEMKLTVVDDCNRVVSDSVIINYPLFDSLMVNFTPLENNCPEGAVELNAVVTGGAGDYLYRWNIDGESTFLSGFGPNTPVSFITPGPGENTFTLEVRDRCNQVGHDMFIDFVEGEQIRTGFNMSEQTIPYINFDVLPNVITPNGDGQNEVFVVPGIDAFEDASVQIYDRWGRLVYESSSYDAGTGEATTSQGFSANGYEDGTYFFVINIDGGECVEQGDLEVLGSSD